VTSGDTLVLVLAVATTLLTVGLLVWFLRDARRRGPEERVDRRRHRRLRRDPREALALVGNALAATHDPRALLPVILEVTVEATGASGGRLLEAGRELAWVGEDRGGKGVSLALSGQEGGTTLVLHPPKEGFSAEALDGARWLVSQAAIALENAQLHHVVQRQASTDELTELANRRRFMDALTAEIGRVERFGGSIALLLADIDDFKRVNDRFGHHAGDEALRRFAVLLAGELREVDIAGRLGGEEFAVLLPETDRDGALIAAERIRAAVARDELVLSGAVRLRFTASLGGGPPPGGAARLGVAAYEGGDAEPFLRQADAALYRAKAEGKNCVVVADAV
jgi:diguanylate cyclase (GGDEF)-like protein